MMKKSIKKYHTAVSYKLLLLTLILGFTVLSCRDSGPASTQPNEGIDLEEIYASKIAPDQTFEMALEEWGLTREELEDAYRLGQSKKKTTSGSNTLNVDSPPIWETDLGTGLNFGADDCKNMEIDFPFTFYGDTYTSLWVNSNGNVTLNKCNESWYPTNIPDYSKKTIIIAPLFGDFEPQETDGDVYVNTVGTAPNRKFIVTWFEIPSFQDSNSEINSFQLQLMEGTNSIIFSYNGLSTDGYGSNNGYPQNVGISKNTEIFINSAKGEEIPPLDGTIICYLPDEEGGYEEIFGSCIPNTPPIADAGPDQEVECEGDTTTVVLDGTGSSDPDGDAITYAWSAGDTLLSTDASPVLGLPMGSHQLSLTVTDENGATGRDSVTIDIVDTTPPDLTYTVHTTRLWPPNNDMHLSVSGIATTDICDADPQLGVTVSIENNNITSTDYEIIENPDGTFDVYLRAKRTGGNGRNYVISIISEDASGNRTEEEVKVNVPKSASASR